MDEKDLSELNKTELTGLGKLAGKLLYQYLEDNGIDVHNDDVAELLFAEKQDLVASVAKSLPDVIVQIIVNTIDVEDIKNKIASMPRPDLEEEHSKKPKKSK